MRTILVVLLMAILAVPATAVGGPSSGSSSQGVAGASTAKASTGKKGKQRKRKSQNRRSARNGTATTASAAASSASSTDNDEVEVTGLIVSLSPLTVGTTTCVVPAGFSLVGFAVGDLVEMTCDLVGGEWVVRKLELEDDAADEADEIEVEGVVTALSPLTVAGVSCAVPAGMSLGGIAVGDVVKMECALVGGQWVVREVEADDDDEDDDVDVDDDDDDDVEDDDDVDDDDDEDDDD